MYVYYYYYYYCGQINDDEMMTCNDADEPKPRQNDLQLVRFNAYSQDADDNDDLMNPTMPITSVRTVTLYV